MHRYLTKDIPCFRLPLSLSQDLLASHFSAQHKALMFPQPKTLLDSRPNKTKLQQDVKLSTGITNHSQSLCISFHCFNVVIYFFGIVNLNRQIPNMNQGRLPAAPAVWGSLLTRYPMDHDILEMIRAIFSFGCMASSAVASPILFEFRMIWLLLVTPATIQRIHS